MRDNLAHLSPAADDRLAVLLLTIQAGGRTERHERRAENKTREEARQREEAAAAATTAAATEYNRSSRFARVVADVDVQEAPLLWSIAIHTTGAKKTEAKEAVAEGAVSKVVEGMAVEEQPKAHRMSLGHVPHRMLLAERATQRVMLMRMAQPALMPDPRCLDSPPPGTMQLRHRESVVQFINEVRCPTPRSPARAPSSYACPDVPPYPHLTPPYPTLPHLTPPYPTSPCTARLHVTGV